MSRTTPGLQEEEPKDSDLREQIEPSQTRITDAISAQVGARLYVEQAAMPWEEGRDKFGDRMTFDRHYPGKKVVLDFVKDDLTETLIGQKFYVAQAHGYTYYLVRGNVIEKVEE